jgi:hypothetical protein
MNGFTSTAKVITTLNEIGPNQLHDLVNGSKRPQSVTTPSVLPCFILWSVDSNSLKTYKSA